MKTGRPQTPDAPRRPRIWRSIVRQQTIVFSGDMAMRWVVRLAAALIIAMLVGLVWMLFAAARPSMKTFGWKFLTTSEWRPNEREIKRPVRDDEGNLVMDEDTGAPMMKVVSVIPPQFGASSVIYGTAVSSLIALLFAVPLSLAAAIFLVRIAPGWRIAAPVSFLVEFLAAIPSIAYGIWGLFVLGPFLQNHVEPAAKAAMGKMWGFQWLFTQHVVIAGENVVRPLALTGFDMLCGGLLLGIMVLPIITAISRDVLRAVPRAQIEGTQALGATWWQSSREMLRYSRSGLFGAIMLGLARAAGETMAVTMVIGNNNQIAASLFAPAQTMSSLLANEFAEANGALHRSALIEVALILLAMSLLFNVVARYLVVGRSSRTAAAH